MIRTPSVTDSTGGARSEKQASERGQMVKTADQVVQLAFENGLKVSPAVAASLMPTPTVSDQYTDNLKSSQQVVGSMHSVTLAQAVLRPDLLPTPVVNDMGAGKSVERWDEWTAATKERLGNGNGHGASLSIEALRLLPTPVASEGTKAPAQQISEEKEKTGQVWLSNAAKDMQLTWGKFEPAIKRWEQVLGRPAPAPTKPDGKDGAHRLSSKFTEWLMGLPEGWITDVGLTRNEELKACGNGVVPQQAELALRHLLEGLI